MMTILRLLRTIAPVALWLMSASQATAENARFFASSGQQHALLTIRAATDIAAMEPLIRDFQASAPEVAVSYVEYVSNDLFLAASKACKADRGLGDILISPSVDQLVKLANDGCIRSHRSAETARAAKWANWRNEVFGFTFEPSVIVYNADRVPSGDVPRTHAQFADLLRDQIDKYRGRIGTYDIRISGIGYLLAYSDSKQTISGYGRLLESMSRAEAVVRCCNSEILDLVTQGGLDLGYNILGSYAYAASLRDPKLKVVIPHDYVLVLNRGAAIPKNAASPELGRRFLDYLLSERGQRSSRKALFSLGRKSRCQRVLTGQRLCWSPAMRDQSGLALRCLLPRTRFSAAVL
jgi:iron(III) transport system substrate-binding protein